MKKHYFLAIALFLLGTLEGFGVVKHENYITKSSGKFYDYYPSWTPGSAPSGTGVTAAVQEDENFFISRVKPLKRFTNKATQVIQDTKTDMRSKRKCLWWCPIGENDWTSLPRYAWDSEAFSSWSYIDIHGNWTESFLRLPGNFADICHKNGVSTSVVSTAAWGVALSSTDGSNGQIYQSLINGGAEKLLKLMKYYGIDGLGFNSEQSWGMRAGMKKLFQDCQAAKATYGMDRLHFDMYNLSSALNTSGGGTEFSDFFPAANGFFLNYNWGDGILSNAVTNAQNLGGNSYDVYGGMDMQGRSSAEWIALDKYAISVGIWGAHNKNMPYESASDLGSTSEAIQYRYLEKCEQLFTGGTKNPVNDLPITNLLTNGTSITFHGIAKLVAAKSSLSWVENSYFPFVTYFNLGNGKFFNDQGVTAYNNEWYNIGMQDFLPTWRWWITTSFMGRTNSTVPDNVTAGFTYEDAYFGGSCLKVKTTAASSFFLHLFKTQFPLASGTTYNLKIRYKVTSGTAKGFAWALSNEGSETTAVNNVIAQNLTASNQWVEKDVNLASGKTLAMMALRFVNTSADFEILIGEVSLMKEGVTYSPVKPTITKSKVMKLTSRGLDFKLIWDCGGRTGKQAWEATYNSDVDTWYYEIWMQQTGKDPQLITTTTSWAGYAVEAPIDLEGTKTVKLGVRAVAPDGVTKSDFAWTSTLTCPAITILEGISVDKPVIKVGETFTVSFDDANHSVANYFKIIKSSTGVEVLEKTFNNVKNFSTTLTEVGLYDVEVNYVNQAGTTVTEIKRGMIQVSGPEVGALPEIYTLTVDENEKKLVPPTAVTFNLQYTGRDADGTTSRGLYLVEKPFCVPISGLYNAVSGLNLNNTAWTISCWFNPTAFIPSGSEAGNTEWGDEGTQMLNIRNPAASWPDSDWGYVWSGIHNGGNDYWFNILKSSQVAGQNFTTRTNGFVVPTGKWTHLAVSVAADKSVSLFINGRLVTDAVRNAGGAASVTANDVIFMGGPAFSRSGFFGAIDEFQIWKQGFTATTVSQTMGHFAPGNYPANLVAYWDFENDQEADLQLTSRVNNVKACVGNTWKNAQGIGSSSIAGTNPNVAGNRMPATWAAGTPFLGGVFQIETLPSWKYTGAPTDKGAAIGTGVGGNTSVKYDVEGDYTATLTLANSWGSDSKSIVLHVVDGTVGLDGNVVENLSVYPNPFVDAVHIQFAKEGDYELEVFGLDGKLISSKAFAAVAGQVARVGVEGESGIYLVRIKTQGKVIDTVKINKK